MDVWTALSTSVAPVCTLLAGVGGVLLTQRATRQRWLDDRGEVHRIEQRDATAKVLTIGPQWRVVFNSCRGFIISNVAPTEQADRDRLARVMQEWKTQSYDYTNALYTASLIVTESSVEASIGRLAYLNAEGLKEWFAITKKDPAIAEQATRTLDSQVAEALRQLETAAKSAFSAVPADKKSKKRNKNKKRGWWHR